MDVGLSDQLAVEEIFEASCDGPLAFAVVQHNRDDQGQGQGFGGCLAFDVTLEDAQDVAQEPQRHELVGRALMLEQDVEERWLACELRREEQIGLRGGERFVHEAARAEGQGRKIGQGDERRWQHGAEFGGRMLDLGEGLLEERVVVLLRLRHAPRTLPRAEARARRGRAPRIAGSTLKSRFRLGMDR